MFYLYICYFYITYTTYVSILKLPKYFYFKMEGHQPLYISKTMFLHIM